MTCNHLWKVAQSNVIPDARREAGEHGYIVWGSVYCTRCGASGNFSSVGVASTLRYNPEPPMCAWECFTEDHRARVPNPHEHGHSGRHRTLEARGRIRRAAELQRVR